METLPCALATRTLCSGIIEVFFAIILTALDEARGKKSADFRQEMLTQSLAQIKQSILEFFSLEMRIRALAPGLWASMYKKTRLKRKQEEKQRPRGARGRLRDSLTRQAC